MTQLQLVLNALSKVERGLTAVELFDKLGIPRNTLATLLWQLKKDGLIQQVGGARGRYLYGITERGREELASEGVDPLTRMVRIAQVSGKGADDLGAVFTVIRDLNSYTTLTNFVQWLTTHKRDATCNCIPVEEDNLHDAVLSFLGVDAASFKAQRESLEAMISLL